MQVERIIAKKNKKLIYDPLGFFLIFIDRKKNEIILEHYKGIYDGKKIVTGRLNKIIVGKNAEEICHTLARENIVSRIEHACYLGRELMKAEEALRKGERYEQD
ncbi:MAG: DUF4346 domain-containing protein [Candidatus Thermoplasmatota archaeon]